MKSVTINEAKCVSCAVCAKVCPLFIIDCEKGQGLARVNPEKRDFCIGCGQCETFCPQEAITVEFEDAKPYAGSPGKQPISQDQITYHMLNRRSVRTYKKTPVAKETLEKLMEIVRFAPTGENAQEVSWILVHDTKKLTELIEITVKWVKDNASTLVDHPMWQLFSYILSGWDIGNDIIFRGAPHLAIAHGPISGLSVPTDAVIAMTYLELAAPTFGIGTCWDGIFQILTTTCPELLKRINLPDDHAVFAALMLGYPEFKALRIPKRKAPKVRWI